MANLKKANWIKIFSLVAALATSGALLIGGSLVEAFGVAAAALSSSTLTN